MSSDRLRLKTPQVESTEVKANVLAAYVAGGRGAELPAVMEAMRAKPSSGFELAFNSACGLAEAGDWAAAEDQLRLALRVGEPARQGWAQGRWRLAAMAPRPSHECSASGLIACLPACLPGNACFPPRPAPPPGEDALYDDELEEEEVAAELAPATAQLAYVAARCATCGRLGAGGRAGTSSPPPLGQPPPGQMPSASAPSPVSQAAPPPSPTLRS